MKTHNIISGILNGSSGKGKSDVPCGVENAVCTNTDDKVVSLFPALNPGGVINFTINFNILYMIMTLAHDFVSPYTI